MMEVSLALTCILAGLAVEGFAVYRANKKNSPISMGTLSVGIGVFAFGLILVMLDIQGPLRSAFL